MNRFLIFTASFLLWQAAGGHASAADDCGQDGIITEMKEPILFQKFEMIDPETEKTYHPDDIIEVPEDGGGIKRIKASAYFERLNQIEQELNAWGYTLRGDFPQELSKLHVCAEALRRQAGNLGTKMPTGIPKSPEELKKQAEDWLALVDKTYEEYKKNVPTLEELYALADDETYDVYMPEVPVYSAPIPTIKPRPIDFKKEKTVRLTGGSSGTFQADLFGYYELGANRLEAAGKAGLRLDGAMVGLYSGELGQAEISARSPGSGNLKIHAFGSVVGKKVFEKTLADGGSLTWGDQFNEGVVYSVNYRFSIGPIPMKAEVGVRGSLGFQWGLTLVPLEVLAQAGPYAAIDGYAQVGADVGIGGAGVGGVLRVASFSLNLNGRGAFEWEEEPLVSLTVAATAEIELLAGELYAYAYYYIPKFGPPWKKRVENRFTFFSWPGMRQQGTLFDYKAIYSRNGLVATGQLSAEDVAEKEYVNRTVRLEAVEKEAGTSLHDVAKAVSEGLNEEATQGILMKAAEIELAGREFDQMLANYTSDLKEIAL